MAMGDPVDNGPAQTNRSLGEKITLLIGVSTLISLGLALIGLGVALSAEIQFGIPHTTIFGSSFELLQLAVWGVANLFSGVGELLKNPLDYVRIGFSSMWMIAAVTVLLAVIATVARFVGLARIRAIRRKRYAACIFRKPSMKRDSYPIVWARIGLIGVLAAVVSFISPILVAAVIIVFCVALALVPVLSIATGEVHIKKYVVGPDICFPAQNRAERMKEWNSPKTKSGSTASSKKIPVATCVSILDGEVVLFSGRVVWATTDSILLFEPDSGEVRRMSLKDRDVKLIDALPVLPVRGATVPDSSEPKSADADAVFRAGSSN
ncbi:MAG: hypothetical protein QM808_12465 [Steroidobacteraceae bacterium]